MKIELDINGSKVVANEGETIIKVAQRHGFYIPHFCYHPKLSIAANCRMCLVEIEKSPKPLPACITVVLDGMVVKIDSPKAKSAQNSVMEFLLINHPLDCPICDQGGECQLQDLAVGYGMSKSRYTEEKRVVMEKNLGPLISTDMTRCIHCTRCVRFGSEVGGIMELGMAGRGEHAEIMPFIEHTVDSELSGNMIDVCPVGALTSKPFRFTARPWELTVKPGISPHDSWGANLNWHTKGNVIKRVTPRDNDDINECWISDRDRFSYIGLTAKDRALTPLMRPDDSGKFALSGWQEIFDKVVKNIKKYNATPDKMGFFISPNSTNEEMFLWQKLARGLGCDNIDSRLRQRDFSVDALSQFDFRIADLKNTQALLMIGVDPAREQPLLGARLRAINSRRLMSIGAWDVSGQLPGALHVGASPAHIAEYLALLNKLLQDKQSADDPAISADMKKIAQKFQKAARDRYIIIGDAICHSSYFSAIYEQTQALLQTTHAKLGVLQSGANVAGARRYGVYPQKNGFHSAAMLKQPLELVMLFNCEPQDFADAPQARSMLTNAAFSCALTPFTDGVKKLAHAVLPIAAAGENEGTTINCEGIAQRFIAAVPPPQEARAGWKILRVLGQKLNLSGFDFSTLDDVRNMMAREEISPPPLLVESDTTNDAHLSWQFEIIGGTAVYEVDMLTRRATVLQATKTGKRSTLAFLHPLDMEQSGIHEGANIRISDGEQYWDTAAFADKRLARGAILAYPPNLHSPMITVEVLPEQNEASS